MFQRDGLDVLKSVEIDTDRLIPDRHTSGDVDEWDGKYYRVGSRGAAIDIHPYGQTPECTCRNRGLPICLCPVDRAKPPTVSLHSGCSQGTCVLCHLTSDKAPDLSFYQAQPWYGELRAQIRCGNIPRWAAVLRCIEAFPTLPMHQQPTMSSLGPVGAVKDTAFDRLMTHCPEKSLLFGDIPVTIELPSKTFIYATMLDVIKEMKTTFNGSRRMIANAINTLLMQMWADLAPRHRLGVHWVYPLNSKHVQQIDGRRGFEADICEILLSLRDDSSDEEE
ncbi:hypothetical protein J8273_8870 [Carpediemonas membranifera]|uniref:Uncharacterized protein n=1 Tax=Carpediemonas membranifera TaxID=201153 RepID=A0A8J6B412_9EUKA|nr:hypothetical protein J8273_8870 [Carpediemonas membranifera]|eukprot:KAG9389577.1 hypothetical protein J8273_8870 [Carpediemonas membranifera]